MKHLEIIKVEEDSLWTRYRYIREEVFVKELNVPIDVETDRDDCLDGSCDHFLIISEDQDIGAVRIKKEQLQIIIQRFCLLQNYRHHGFGREVLAYVEAYYKNKGYYRIVLDSKYRVYQFYEKCGYHKISNVFIEAHVEHVKMEKELLSYQKYDDLPEEAITIRTDIFVKEQGFQDEFDDRDHHCQHLVFYDGKQAIGTCRYFKEDDHFVLGRIAVIESYRNKKVGTFIIDTACTLMKSGTVILHAQLQAKVFYEKLGFEAYGDIEYEEHCPHIWMKKYLR